MTLKPTSEQIADYQNLVSGSGYIKLAPRTWVSFTGEDRQTFLHNFCTADIKKLEPGNLAEAFFLNGKGKILAHGFLIAFEDQIVFSAVGDQAPAICEHLNRYIIREDVDLKDESEDRVSLFVPRADGSLGWMHAISTMYSDEANTHNGSVVLCVGRMELAGDGWMLSGLADGIGLIESKLQDAGLKSCSHESLEMLRVENGTPWFGADINEDHLPQELNRDEKAISFVKGCYLGQETVARIDAIGRVNKLLVSLSLGEEAPVAGAELFEADSDSEKAIGVASSVAWSPEKSGFVALAMLRRKHAEAMTKVRW